MATTSSSSSSSTSPFLLFFCFSSSSSSSRSSSPSPTSSVDEDTSLSSNSNFSSSWISSAIAFQSLTSIPSFSSLFSSCSSWSRDACLNTCVTSSSLSSPSSTASSETSSSEAPFFSSILIWSILRSLPLTSPLTVPFLSILCRLDSMPVLVINCCWSFRFLVSRASLLSVVTNGGLSSFSFSSPLHFSFSLSLFSSGASCSACSRSMNPLISALFLGISLASNHLGVNW